MNVVCLFVLEDTYFKLNIKYGTAKIRHSLQEISSEPLTVSFIS